MKKVSIVTTGISTLAILVSFNIFFLGKANAEISLIAGYKYLHIDYYYNHETHPDDEGILLDEPAGTTFVDQGTSWAYFAVRYHNDDQKINRKGRKGDEDPFILFHIDAGLLLRGYKTTDNYADNKQNDNDPRPADEGSFIYSRIPFWGLTGSTGVAYKSVPWIIGVESQMSAILIENGWDRFNTDEVSDREFAIIPTIGPKVGYLYEFGVEKNESRKAIGIEATVQFGENVNGSVAISYQF